MAEIRPLSTESLRAAAFAAAEQHIPLSECNHYEKGTDLWHAFNAAYRAAESKTHAERRVREREACTC